MHPFRTIFLIIAIGIIGILSVYLLPVMQAYASYSIDADFKRYNDDNTYVISGDIPYVNLQSVKNTKYAYKAAEANYLLNLNNSIALIAFANMQKHSVQDNKLEQSISTGLSYDNCSISLGVRKDILGQSPLVRPSCTFNQTFNNLKIEHKYSYIYTSKSDYISAKLKLYLLENIYLASSYKKFTGRSVANYDWELHSLSVGVSF